MCQQKIPTTVGSQHRPRTDSSSPGVAGDGTDGQRRVHRIARPALTRWASADDELTATRLQLGSAFVFGLLWIPLWLVLGTSVFDGTVTGLLFSLSVFAFVVFGSLHELLSDLERAKSVWWNDSISATVGLYTLAALVKIGAASAVGRVIWRCTFDVEYPATASAHPTDRGGRSLLERLRPYNRYVSLFSLAFTLLGVAFWERLWEGVVSLNSLVANGGAVTMLPVGVAAVVVGAGVGGAFAVVGR